MSIRSICQLGAAALLIVASVALPWSMFADYRVFLSVSVAPATFAMIIVADLALVLAIWPPRRLAVIGSVLSIAGNGALFSPLVIDWHSDYWGLLYLTDLACLGVSFQGVLVNMWAVALSLYRGRPVPPGHCTRCGYNLFGLQDPRCPECGTAFSRVDRSTYATRPCPRRTSWVLRPMAGAAGIIAATLLAQVIAKAASRWLALPLVDLEVFPPFFYWVNKGRMPWADLFLTPCMEGLLGVLLLRLAAFQFMELATSVVVSVLIMSWLPWDIYNIIQRAMALGPSYSDTMHTLFGTAIGAATVGVFCGMPFLLGAVVGRAFSSSGRAPDSAGLVTGFTRSEATGSVGLHERGQGDISNP